MKYEAICALNLKMAGKFSPDDGIARNYAGDISVLRPLLDRHPNWGIRRIDYGLWQVRIDDSGNFDLGETIEIALCKALLNVKVKP